MSVKFLADEDLDARITDGLRSLEPSIDLLDLKAAGKLAMSDPRVLALAAAEGRIVVSHDRRTMTRHFRARVESGEPSPGLFIVRQRKAIGEVITSLMIVWAASSPEDWRDTIQYLPFR